MRNSRCRALCYFALPAVLLVACVLQPSQASAETNSLGVDCAKIDVASLMMQDNMRAGLILIQCGIVQGGTVRRRGWATSPTAPPNVRVSNASDCQLLANVCGSESMVAASTADKGQTIVVNYNANGRLTRTTYTGTVLLHRWRGDLQGNSPSPFDNSHGLNSGDPIVVFNSKLGEFFAGDLVDGLWRFRHRLVDL